MNAINPTIDDKLLKTLFITHKDLDAEGGKILAHFCFDDLDIQQFTNPRELSGKILFLNLDKYDQIFIVDISVFDDIALILDKRHKSGKHIKLYDHHSTALELNKYSWCVVTELDYETNLKTSGTELFYKYEQMRLDYLSPSINVNIERMVYLFTMYDSYRWTPDKEDIPEAKLWCDLFFLLGDEFTKTCINKILMSSFTLDQSELYLLRITQIAVDKYIEERKVINYLFKFSENIYYNLGVIFADNHISAIAQKVCIENSDIDVVAIVDLNRQHIRFNTIKDIDVSLIAKRFGGGGHDKSAGCDIPEPLTEYLFLCLFTPERDDI